MDNYYNSDPKGDCWVCGGTGHVQKAGGKKTVTCGECSGTGWTERKEEETK